MPDKKSKGHEPIGFLGKMKRKAEIGIAAANIVVGASQVGEINDHLQHKGTDPTPTQAYVNRAENDLRKRGRERLNLQTDDKDPKLDV